MKHSRPDLNVDKFKQIAWKIHIINQMNTHANLDLDEQEIWHVLQDPGVVTRLPELHRLPTYQVHATCKRSPWMNLHHWALRHMLYNVACTAALQVQASLLICTYNLFILLWNNIRRNKCLVCVSVIHFLETLQVRPSLQKNFATQLSHIINSSINSRPQNTKHIIHKDWHLNQTHGNDTAYASVCDKILTGIIQTWIPFAYPRMRSKGATLPDASPPDGLLFTSTSHTQTQQNIFTYTGI